MKVFIFGAGASKGAINNLNGTNITFPVTNELFDEKYSAFWRQVFFSDQDIASLRKNLGEKDFEEWLTDRWKNIEKSQNERQKRILLREFGRLTLYIWNLFNSLSNLYSEPNEYRTLIDGLNELGEDYGLISFNYDTFLERAYMNANMGATLSRRKDYYEEGIVKPHGSVNWFLRHRDHDRAAERPHDRDIESRFNLVCSQMYDGMLFNNSHNVEVGPSHVDMRDIFSLINERFSYQYFYPLIFIPTLGKMTNFVENFYEENIEKSIEMIKKADEIFVIGYQARDKAIRQILLSAKEETILNVVSKNNANQTSENILKWAKNLRRGSVINGGFTSFNFFHLKSI